MALEVINTRPIIEKKFIETELAIRADMEPLYWSIILLIAGLIVFGLEFFVPSAGLLGFLCAVLLCASVVFGFMHHWMTGVAILLAIAIMLPMFFSVGVKIWPHTPLGKRILLRRMEPADILPDTKPVDELKALVGQIGLAKSKMLPSGLVRIADRSYDAISDGFPIDSGDRVRVIAVRTKRIVVRPVAENEPDLVNTGKDHDYLLAQSIEDLGIESLDDEA